MFRSTALLSLFIACLALDGRPPTTMSYDRSDPVRWCGSLTAKRHVDATWKLFGNREYSAAIRNCEQGYREMKAQRRTRAALWYLNILAGSRFRLGQYRSALDTYLEARDLALRSGMAPEAAMALSNLSTLYMHVFDTELALAASEEAVALLRPGKYWVERSAALLQQGRVLLMRNQGERARPLFLQVIQDASRRGDAERESQAWDGLGGESVRAHEYSAAETALTNAFLLRRLNQDPNLFVTEWKLAELAFQRGDLGKARHLIEASLSHSRPDVQIPMHRLYLTKASVLVAQGDLHGALRDFILAADSAEEWRARGLFADAFRISADAGLDTIYSGAVDTAARLYARERSPKYAEMAWLLSERNRSASLRDAVRGHREWTRRVGPSYWRALDRLRELDAERISGGPMASAAGEGVRLRMQLAELESQAGAWEKGASPAKGVMIEIAGANRGSNAGGPENSPRTISLSNIQRVLGNARKLICFRLGDRVSYRWVITNRTLELKTLSGRGEMGRRIRDLREALESGSETTSARSQIVYSGLFSGISQRDSARWLIALDDDLFDAPLASMVCRQRAGRPEYLIEQRAIEVVPGAWAIGKDELGARTGGFLGIGDGVYNTADPRYRGVGAVRGWFSFVPSLFAAETGPMQLARLVGSGTEIRNAAGVSGSAALLLTGVRVNRKELLEGLATGPRMIHIAAHFVAEGGDAGTAAVVLGVRPDGAGVPKLDLLTAKDIASLEAPGSVVVLSGCSSGAGRVVAAAGVLGLARAWLSAGARAVVATHWATVDGTGDLFKRFYRYSSGADGTAPLAPAEALRKAQLDMLRSGNSKSEPRNWAAYQIVGRSN